MRGKRALSWSTGEGGTFEKDEKRTGEEEEEEHRSLLETGGDEDADCGDDDGGEGRSSSKNDLLLPHTIADIVQSQYLSALFLFDPIPFESGLISEFWFWSD